MLIDRTYFVGTIAVANAINSGGSDAVGSLLDWYIEKYEPIFLEDVLGLTLYNALKAGYSQPAPLQKWVNLVQGTTYTDCQNKQKHWKGLVTQPASVLNAFDAVNDKYIVVGNGGAYDPITGSTTTVIPPEYVGKDFRFYQRAFGQLKPLIEYTVSGNILTLVGNVFAVSDTFWYKSATLAINTTTGSSKQSLIANYIYYWYQRNLYTQTTTMSEVKTKTENADRADPFQKMAFAWNEMVKWLCDMVSFLDANVTDYTEWNDQDKCKLKRSFSTINEFGI